MVRQGAQATGRAVDRRVRGSEGPADSDINEGRLDADADQKRMRGYESYRAGMKFLQRD